jgi:hypothetical protein
MSRGSAHDGRTNFSAVPLFCSAVLLFAASCVPTAHAQSVSLTARLKAAVLSKFPQFVEWPAAVIEGRSSVDLCVGEPDPFGTDLSELVMGESLNGRPIVPRHVVRDEDLATCHVLYLPPRQGARNPLLTKAESLPILTVGEDRRFLDEGGIIQLHVIDGRVRFEINVAAAQRVGLRLSSQLLRLAMSVKGAAR